MRTRSAFIVWVAVCCIVAGVRAQRDTVVVGAKNFTESSVLAELMAQVIEEHADLTVERRTNLGGTMICHAALLAGEIDLYADYTGTAWSAILKETGAIRPPLDTFFHVRRRYLDEFDVRWLEPFGLANTYALAMRATVADELGIRRISDLIPHQQQLRAGFSFEFGSSSTNREDGYHGLASAYGLALGSVRVLEHGLAYQAIQSGSIDLMDAYSTDGKLLRYQLRVLEDDRQFFPPYNAAPLVRASTLREFPKLEPALSRLALRIPDTAAQSLNYVVETEGSSARLVARAYLEIEGLVAGRNPDAAPTRTALERVLAERPEPGAKTTPRAGLWQRLGDRAGLTFELLLQHLGLTLCAVLLAASIAIPLGILIVKRPRLRQIALGVASVIQTIPSLALLAFMIPILGLDLKAAIAALFLYALLPILRNTYTGIAEVDPDLVEAAKGIGMRPGQVLTRVQLPLAMRTIMAGIRTSTVISIGIATLAAFIGAGGLGEPIVEGLYLDDTVLILSGAIPAALLAIFADVALGRVEIALQPR